MQDYKNELLVFLQDEKLFWSTFKRCELGNQPYLFVWHFVNFNHHNTAMQGGNAAYFCKGR